MLVLNNKKYHNGFANLLRKLNFFLLTKDYGYFLINLIQQIALDI